MSEHYEKHAEQVTSAFLELLDGDVRARISDEHRQELAMLVEAAISTAVLEQLEHAADQVSALSQSIRHGAEHYDKTG
ncbi:MAG: phosphatase [Gammaproteobacteria bacterium]|nr:phosphatase [Gammaproteobacteria bacterium]MCP5298395.1 phosphatase [Chromatiaceae bacterium]